MITMPIAGALADQLPVGRIVPFGLVLIMVGMFGLTQVTVDDAVRGSSSVLFDHGPRAWARR